MHYKYGGNIMEKIMLPVQFMKYGYIFIPAFIIFFIMEVLTNSQILKEVLLLLKTLAYAGLGYVIWKFYQGKQEIDVMTAFTFIFCCFEAVDNFFSLILIPIMQYKHAEERTQDKLDIINNLRR